MNTTYYKLTITDKISAKQFSLNFSSLDNLLESVRNIFEKELVFDNNNKAETDFYLFNYKMQVMQVTSLLSGQIDYILESIR